MRLIYGGVYVGNDNRMFVHWKDPMNKDVRYATLYNPKTIPQPHTSGYWVHGFEFNNIWFLQLGVF